MKSTQTNVKVAHFVQDNAQFKQFRAKLAKNLKLTKKYVSSAESVVLLATLVLLKGVNYDNQN